MNKVIAEIVAGVIPHKMTRNRWRGILRFGLRNALKLRREIRNNNEIVPSHYLSVCVIAKDEGPYFKEWLEWHREKGVEKFYVYDNGSTDNTREILAPFIEKGIVDYIWFPGHRMQLAAYDDCLKRNRYKTRWLGFIDMDEFIVPIKDKTIPEFLKPLEGAASVEINWLVYGSGGAKNHEKGSQMQRFKWHSLPEHPLNRHVKSIVDPRKVYCMIGCHEAARIEGVGLDSTGKKITVSWKDRTPDQNHIKINHYAVRSLEEFIEKQNRGRASGTVKHIENEYFLRFDLNDLKDE